MHRDKSTLEVVFVTCGQSVEDQQKVLDSHYSGSLSKTGKQQAAKLSKHLDYASFSAVICSPSAQAIETGSILFPNKKLASLSSVGPFKYGCLATKSRSQMFVSLLASDVPEREFKVKGADNLEILRSRVKEFFKRLACGMLWGKNDSLLINKKNESRILVITHEIFVLEMLEYIKDREERINIIKEGKLNYTTETDEASNEYGTENAPIYIEVSQRDLQEYNQHGRLPSDPASNIRKTKILTLNGDNSPKTFKTRSSTFESHAFQALVINRTVPSQYLAVNSCSVTKVIVSCSSMDVCHQLARTELTDDYLEYVIQSERDVSHLTK